MSARPEGHRARLRERFLRAGLRGFDDLELLELLLTYAIPRRDTRGIAASMLERFGTLRSVFSQPPDMLRTCPEVGRAASAFVSMLGQVQGRLLEPPGGSVVLDSASGVKDYLRARMGDRRKETLAALLLDSGGRLLSEAVLEYGTVDRASVHPRNLVEKVICTNATAVVLVHNHPGGRLEASREDRALTARLDELGRSLGFRVLDHFIVTSNGVLSLREQGLMGSP